MTSKQSFNQRVGVDPSCFNFSFKMARVWTWGLRKMLVVCSTLIAMNCLHTEWHALQQAKHQALVSLSLS